MHKNEAISRVAERAMEQIYDIAQFAISKITNDYDNNEEISEDIRRYSAQQLQDFRELGQRQAREATIEPMAQTSFTEVSARATALDALAKNDADEIAPPKQTRKPRTPKTQEVLEPTHTSENDFVETTKEIEVEPEDVKVLEDKSFLGVSAQDANVEQEQDDNPEFPNHPDAFFTSDVEQARQLCRKLLSKLVSKDGHDSARKAIVETTQKVKVTDFDANDCMTFYRKYRNNV